MSANASGHGDHVTRSGKSKRKTRLPFQAQLNSAIQKHDCKQQLEKAFLDHTSTTHAESGAELHSSPFSHCILPNFIKDEQFLEGLKDELVDQIFCEKSNDLYKFQQTDDLKKISSPYIRAIRKLLYGDFLDWMRDVTGIALIDRVSITCSRYEHTDILLCHDDELETRRIAFILYLVPPWKLTDGGTLDLYNMDEFGQPGDIVKSIVPLWNSLAWFQVTEASHHQVSEVLSKDKVRLSVNGWFYGPPVTRPDRCVGARLPMSPHIPIEEQMVYDWINPIYLDSAVQVQIQERFENDSEIELQGFLKEDKYQALTAALKSADITWEKRGPANKMCYTYAPASSHPGVLAECVTLMQSEAMFLIISNLTGLCLHALADTHEEDEEEDEKEMTADMETAPSGSQPKNKPKRRRLTSDGTSDEDKVGKARCHCEVRRWQQGNYTLLHDTDPEGSEFALDAMLYCLCKGWQQEFGGYTSYVARGEDEELLTVNPAENSLALVYRDKQTLRFVKHINSRIQQMPSAPEFYDLALVYVE